MPHEYLYVFLASFLVDVVPFPLPPAFTVMVLLQIKFKLNIWLVIVVGVIGSILGRLVLTLYIPHLSGKIFSKRKNQDVEYLGGRLKKDGIRGQLFILGYSLMPLPTTPLFLGAGIAKLKPWYVIPAFTIGKFISDAIAVLLGDYAVKNSQDIIHGVFSWKSVTGLVLGLALVFALLFVDWITLLKEKKLRLRMNILRKNEKEKPDKKSKTGS
jgi:membrane protein YqaA with SNARE-associated domain